MSLSPYIFLVEIKNRNVYNIMDCKFEEDKCEMKKFAAIAMMLIMCVGLLAGCGSSYAADESTVLYLRMDKSFLQMLKTLTKIHMMWMD